LKWGFAYSISMTSSQNLKFFYTGRTKERFSGKKTPDQIAMLKGRRKREMTSDLTGDRTVGEFCHNIGGQSTRRRVQKPFEHLEEVKDLEWLPRERYTRKKRNVGPRNRRCDCRTLAKFRK